MSASHNPAGSRASGKPPKAKKDERNGADREAAMKKYEDARQKVNGKLAQLNEDLAQYTQVVSMMTKFAERTVDSLAYFKKTRKEMHFHGGLQEPSVKVFRTFERITDQAKNDQWELKIGIDIACEYIESWIEILEDKLRDAEISDKATTETIKKETDGLLNELRKQEQRDEKVPRKLLKAIEEVEGEDA